MQSAEPPRVKGRCPPRVGTPPTLFIFETRIRESPSFLQREEELPCPKHKRKPSHLTNEICLSRPLCEVQDRPSRRTTKPPPLRERELKKPEPEPEPRRPEVQKGVATTKAQETRQGEEEKWEVVNPETDEVGRCVSYLNVRECILARMVAPSIGPWQRK